MFWSNKYTNLVCFILLLHYKVKVGFVNKKALLVKRGETKLSHSVSSFPISTSSGIGSVDEVFHTKYIIYLTYPKETQSQEPGSPCTIVAEVTTMATATPKKSHKPTTTRPFTCVVIFTLFYSIFCCHRVMMLIPRKLRTYPILRQARHRST